MIFLRTNHGAPEILPRPRCCSSKCIHEFVQHSAKNSRIRRMCQLQRIMFLDQVHPSGSSHKLVSPQGAHTAGWIYHQSKERAPTDQSDSVVLCGSRSFSPSQPFPLSTPIRPHFPRRALLLPCDVDDLQPSHHLLQLVVISQWRNVHLRPT